MAFDAILAGLIVAPNATINIAVAAAPSTGGLVASTPYNSD